MIDIHVLKKLENVHVLIVEDDEITRYGLKQSLEMYCKKVDIADNGISGFEIFENSKPDVVIADINLPEMNGLEMVSAMHAISPHLPVIIITSYDSSENIMKSIEQNAYNYLRKPIKIEELQITLLMATKNMFHSQIKLKKGFVYNMKDKTLKDSMDTTIIFTKMEIDLLHLLISNLNNVIGYATIMA